MTDISPRLNTPFKKKRDITIFNSFGTYYGYYFIDFIENFKNTCYQHGIDILQKQNKYLFLDFLTFTCKLIDCNHLIR